MMNTTTYRSRPGLIELRGTPCSGKTYVINRALKLPGISSWDVKAFYHQTGVLHNGVMDWDRWREVAPEIPGEIYSFVRKHEDDKIILIEHMCNAIISETLNALDGYALTVIQLLTPPVEVLVTRAIERRDNPQGVLELLAQYDRGINRIRQSMAERVRPYTDIAPEYAFHIIETTWRAKL